MICDKELLSIILALKHWYGLLKHAEVIVYTDSLSAKYIASSDKQTSSRRAKLVANLALFDNVTIIHIAGDRNTVADFLSRVYDSVLEDDDDHIDGLTLKQKKERAEKERRRVEELLKQDGELVSDLVGNIMRHVTEQSHRKKSNDESRPSNIFPMLPQPVTIEDNQNTNLESEELAILNHITHERQTYELVHRLQNDNVYMAPIIKYLDKGRFETYLPYAIKNLVIRESNKYCLHNGILYTKADEHGRIQLVVPLQLRSKILEVYHDSVFSTHPGHREMAAKVAKQYFWNGMNGDISNYVNNCNVCQLVKRAHKTITPPLGPHPVARTIGERWSLDFLERLRPSKDGYRHVVIAVEHVTRFVLLEPLKTLTADET